MRLQGKVRPDMPEPLDTSSRFGPNDRVGPYRLLNVLGEGGFGVVYLAERSAPFVQRVALKVLKADLDSRAVVARFEQERQALALMDHPGVARVLDGGLTEQGCVLGAGRPYFVMELVQGSPITEYCATRGLGLRQRLQLFMSVCDAVQHAHMKGVIHRDLKPSNILVSDSTGEPTPKVIDFGIAKAISGPGHDTASMARAAALLTERGQFIGTPEYMSPEQADARGDVDTRTDVYALGVILYELLTGELPFSHRDLREAGLAEILRIIREVEPPMPSTRLSAIAAERTRESSPGSGSAQSSVFPMPVTRVRELRGDLDWIVMRALEKARARRYDSPSAFAADIRRYLRTEPVEAGPPSVAYRLSKFARRNRGLVIAGTVSVLALSAGLGVAMVALSEATTARDRLTEALQKATDARNAAELARESERQQRLRAEASAAFIQKSIESANPWIEPSSMTVPELLDAMSDLASSGALKDDPAMLAEVRVMIGGCYIAMGRPRDAQPHLRAALDSQRAAPGVSPALTPVTVKSSLYLASALNALGQAREALLVLDVLEPLTLAPMTIPERATAGEIAFERGRSHMLLSQRELAETQFKRSIDEYEAAGEDYALDAASGHGALGVLYAEWAGRQSQAIAPSVRALEVRRALAGPSSPLAQNALHNLARAHQENGMFAEAVAGYRAAIDAHVARGGPPTAALALSQNNLALLCRELGEPEEALRLAQQALITRQALDPRSVEVAEILDLIAGIRADRGSQEDLLAAVDMYVQELVIVDKPEPHLARHASRALTGLAGVLTRLGRSEEAIPHARRAVHLREQYMAAGDWRIDSSRSTLGAALAETGQLAEAQPLLIAAAEAALASGTLSASKKAPFVDRVVRFFELSGKPLEADRWRARRPSDSAPRPTR